MLGGVSGCSSPHSTTATPNSLQTTHEFNQVRERAYRLVAYGAVSAALVAIIAVCVTMPIVYNFITHIEQQSSRELEFCKVGHSHYPSTIPSHNRVC